MRFRGFLVIAVSSQFFSMKFLLQQDPISLLPQTSKVLLEVVWVAWKRALKLEFWPFWCFWQLFMQPLEVQDLKLC